jgi:hypothetical protein
MWMDSVVISAVLIFCHFIGAGNYKIQDIAYDAVSGALFWTGETAIYWYTSTMESRTGEVVHMLNDTEFPHGITVASCRR